MWIPLRLSERIIRFVPFRLLSKRNCLKKILSDEKHSDPFQFQLRWEIRWIIRLCLSQGPTHADPWLEVGETRAEHWVISPFSEVMGCLISAPWTERTKKSKRKILLWFFPLKGLTLWPICNGVTQNKIYFIHLSAGTSLLHIQLDGWAHRDTQLHPSAGSLLSLPPQNGLYPEQWCNKCSFSVCGCGTSSSIRFCQYNCKIHQSRSGAIGPVLTGHMWEVSFDFHRVQTVNGPIGKASRNQVQGFNISVRWRDRCFTSATCQCWCHRDG